MDISAVSFWRRVNGLIKARKTRQEDVARECGISYQTFRGWVCRKTFPGADDAYRIAQALGATVEHLVFGNDCDESEQVATEMELERSLAIIYDTIRDVNMAIVLLEKALRRMNGGAEQPAA